jgi:hypothetical protein
MSLLRPYPKEQQQMLIHVDRICQENAKRIQDEVNKQLLANPKTQPKLDDEDQGWVLIIKAYGLLYNKAIDLGLVKDVIIATRPVHK